MFDNSVFGNIILNPGSNDGIESTDNVTLSKNHRSFPKKWMGLFSNTSSYMAVPIRATLLSALVLVPYMTLVPIASMLFSSSISTTSLMIIVMVQLLGTVRWRPGVNFTNILRAAFRAYILGFILFGARISARKPRVKCWWNWQQLKKDWRTLVSCEICVRIYINIAR